MVEDMVEQQKEYHVQFRVLMSMYEKLAEERSEIQAIFLKQTRLNNEKESKVLWRYKAWLSGKEQALTDH